MYVLKPQDWAVTKNKKPRMRSFLGHFNFTFSQFSGPPPYTNGRGALALLNGSFLVDGWKIVFFFSSHGTLVTNLVSIKLFQNATTKIAKYIPK
jgi:hypothetical protein